MKLHTYEFGQTIPCILTEQGTYATHHLTPDGLEGERVTDDTATHFFVVESVVRNPITMEIQPISFAIVKNDF